MKKNIAILLSLFLLVFSCKKEPTTVLDKPLKYFTITSDISGIKDSISVILNQKKLDETKRIDSIVNKNGVFKIKVPSDKSYQKYEIRLKKYPSKRYITSIDIWSKDQDINISGTYNGKFIQDLKIEGCNLNNIEKEYQDILQKSGEKYNKEIESAKTQGAKDTVFLKVMNLMYADQIKFIYKNPNNIVSLTNIFIHTYRISKDSLKMYYNKLDPILQNSAKGKVLKEISSTKKLKIGDYIQDFEAKGINGNKVKLSDFKGKIILLDFWASWCAPCKEQNKNEFTDLDKKFKNKGLVIISYSLDKKNADQAWKKATENTIRWISISNLKGFRDPIAVQYGIHEIPNSFLINRQGVIVKSFKGYDKKSNKIEKEIKILLD